MKKIVLILVFLFALHAGAQVTVQPGIRAGLNLANFTNTEFDTKADFYVGALVAVKLTRFYTLQPELTYTRQGAKGKFAETNFDPVITPSDTYEKDYSLQYISLAGMNKITFTENFSIIAGPSIDFKVSDNFTREEKRDLSGVDLALNAGLNYRLPIGLIIEARYKIGLQQVFDNGDFYSDDDFGNDILNSVFQFGFAYTFKNTK